MDISLQTNVIDGVMTNYDGLHMMNFFEEGPKVILGTKLWWSAPFLHTINLDAWNSLPVDIQDGILRATETAQKKFADVYQEELQQAMREQEEAGAVVKIADEEDIAMFNDEELFERLRDVWAKEAKEKHGIEDADQYVEDLDQIITEVLEEYEE